LPEVYVFRIYLGKVVVPVYVSDGEVEVHRYFQLSVYNIMSEIIYTILEFLILLESKI